MQPPSVCLGIVTRNRAQSLRKAIASAIQQKGANMEIVVLDDGSTDETIDLRAQFPELSWIRRDEDAGYISARNELMRRGNFDYFVSLDDDAWFVSDDEISVAINFVKENPAIGAVAFDILSPDRPNPKGRGAPQTVATFIGCGHVLRMSAVRDVGPYEETPGGYGGEEKDLCLRLMDAGYQIVRLPGVHVWHDKTSVARELTSQHRSGVCNDLIMTLRRTPALFLPAAILVKLYRHFRFSLKHGLMRACLQGFKLFACSIPTALRTRRPVRITTLRTFMRLARTT